MYLLLWLHLHYETSIHLHSVSKAVRHFARRKHKVRPNWHRRTTYWPASSILPTWIHLLLYFLTIYFRRYLYPRLPSAFPNDYNIYHLLTPIRKQKTGYLQRLLISAILLFHCGYPVHKYWFRYPKPTIYRLHDLADA